MTLALPRVRMFAGPNGSGKTTVQKGLRRSPEWFGSYINPDDLEKAWRESGSIPLQGALATASDPVFRNFFGQSAWLKSRLPDFDPSGLAVRQGALQVPCPPNSYVVSVLADLLRRTCVENRESFTFETVMSSRDKVDLLRLCRTAGYRTYLYFVATEDPEINLARVRLRVSQGGHDVPTEKVVSRYSRSISLLADAIGQADRAFLFDTSSEEPWYFAEVTGGQHVDLKGPEIPNWFRPVWTSLTAG